MLAITSTAVAICKIIEYLEWLYETFGDDLVWLSRKGVECAKWFKIIVRRAVHWIFRSEEMARMWQLILYSEEMEPLWLRAPRVHRYFRRATNIDSLIEGNLFTKIL
jgi:hypothetical protein